MHTSPVELPAAAAALPVGVSYTSIPSLVVLAAVLLVVLIVGRLVLALAWRLVLLALAVLLVLWLLGAVGLYPF